MSTHSEKPVPNPVAAALPVVLHSRHQWLRWRGMLIAGIIGLAATLIAIWVIPNLRHAPVPKLAEIWGGGLVATLAAVAIASRWAPDSLLVTARKLDGRFAAKGRMEAAAVLKDSASPLAIAQREETALYLARETQARAVRVLPWLRGILIALVLAHLVTLGLWIAPAFSLSAKPVVAATPPPRGHPAASITWQSPEAATEANPVEEVPVVATADSTTGLRNLTLEISVNGEVKKSIPLPDDTSATPGSHEIKVAVPLDDLKVQPFDVVSYYLQGQRISPENEPETTSPVQFVEVRPFRDAATPASPAGTPPGGTPPGNAPDILNRLELAELRSIQDNFALAHSDLAPNDPARAQETARVGQEQTALAGKTEEIAKALADEHLAAATLDPLRQAEPLMDDSGKKILAAQNSAAADSQQKALSLIVAGEKSVYQAVAATAPPAGAKSDASFADTQKHELPKPQQTLVGQLETLEKNQTQLAQDIGENADDSSATPSPDASTSPSANPPATNPAATSSTPNGTPPTSPSASSPAVDPFGPDADQGSPAERQERVIQGIATLQDKTRTLPETGSDELASAQKQATDSLQQLSAEQAPAAREPAAAAALDLQLTLRALDQAGATETRQTLAQTQQQLNALASQLRGVAQGHSADAAPRLLDLAAQVHDVQQGLESAADHQQDTGSAQGADQLNQLASQMQQQQVAPNLAAMSKSGLDPGRASAQADALENLARQAGSGMIPAQPTPQDYAGLADSLERTEANLAHLADNAAQDSNGTTPASGTPADAPGSQPGQQSGQQAPSQSGTQPGQQASSPGGVQPGQQASSQGGTQSGQQASSQGGTQPGQQASSQGGTQPGQQASSQASAQPGQQASSQPGQPATPQPGQQAAGNQPGEKSSPAPANNPSTAEAYHEALQDLKNQTQQTAQVVPKADADAVEQVIKRYDKDTSYREVKDVDVVRFHADLQQPLAKLILDVQALQQHAQRDELVKTPDLDETPAAYRPAVSRYFQDVSRDYHSPPPDQPKP